MKDELLELLRSRCGGPFLFVGSGFSRRYLGLEDWRGILGRFCVAGKPFEYYLAAADGDMPKAAGLLARDFNEHWWSSPDYKQSVERDRGKISDSTSALRIEMCRYLSTLDQAKAKASEYAEEVELLAGLNVDGVITTNWDMFLEQIFPDYRVYIGQKELLFSNPQQIGEIYKIHGCSSKPQSLVLTDADYKEFNDRNAYLAAKLITLFVEHPIVFLGYSLSDENITSLLRALSLCIGRDDVEQFRRNLIFVQRSSAGDAPGISDTYLTIDGVQIPLVLARTSDFKPVYRALAETKRKIPARILRYCKEELYALALSGEPQDRLCVVDFDEIDKNEDIEFLVGVGVAKETREAPEIGQIGYAPVGADDLFHDVLHEDRNYDPRQVVENVVPLAGRNTRNIPVFKYLDALGIRSIEHYKKSGLRLDKWVNRDLKEFRVKMYSSGFFKVRTLSIQDLIVATTAENATGYIPWMPREKIDLAVLRQFLLTNEPSIYTKGPYQSNFRKLGALYDKLKWGW